MDGLGEAGLESCCGGQGMILVCNREMEACDKGLGFLRELTLAKPRQAFYLACLWSGVKGGAIAGQGAKADNRS